MNTKFQKQPAKPYVYKAGCREESNELNLAYIQHFHDQQEKYSYDLLSFAMRE